MFFISVFTRILKAKTFYMNSNLLSKIPLHNICPDGESREKKETLVIKDYSQVVFI